MVTKNVSQQSHFLDLGCRLYIIYFLNNIIFFYGVWNIKFFDHEIISLNDVLQIEENGLTRIIINRLDIQSKFWHFKSGDSKEIITFCGISVTLFFYYLI